MLIKITVTTISLIVSLIAGYFIFLKDDENTNNLAIKSSEPTKEVGAPTPSPTPAVLNYKPTNLEYELEIINPQVSEDDFTQLNDLIKSF